MAEVVGFRGERVLLMPLGETIGLHPGCEVVATDRPPLPVADEKLLAASSTPWAARWIATAPWRCNGSMPRR